MEWIALALVFVIALVMAFIAKRVPIAGKIAEIAVAIYLIGVLFSLQGITLISDLVAQIPYLSYVLAFPAGVLIGSAVMDWLPF